MNTTLKPIFLEEQQQEENNDNTFCSILFANNLFDLPQSQFFYTQGEQFLIQFDNRCLFLFKVEENGKINFLRRYIFYNVFLDFRIIDEENKILFGIYFKGNYFIVLKFTVETLTFNSIAYFNFNIKKNVNFKITHFEEKTQLKFSQNYDFFYLVLDNNKIQVGGKKGGDFEWLFNWNSKNLPQNNFFSISENVYGFDNFFHNRTFLMNFKEIVSEKIKDLVIIKQNNDLVAFLLTTKSIPSLIQNASKIISFSSRLIKIKLHSEVIKKIIRKAQIDFIEEVFLNQLIFDYIKKQINNFWVIQLQETNFLFKTDQFLVLMSNTNFCIITFTQDIYEHFVQKFDNTKILNFSSKSKEKIYQFQIEQKKNFLLIIFNKIYFFLYFPQQTIDLYYFSTPFQIDDISLEKMEAIFVINNKKQLKKIIVKNTTNLSQNKIGINSLIELSLENKTEQNPKKNLPIIDYFIKEQNSYIIEKKNIWDFPRDPFKLFEEIETPKIFLNSWNLGELNGNINILLIDHNYKFFLFDARNKNLKTHYPGFNLTVNNYQGILIQNKFFALINNFDVFILDRETVTLKNKINFSQETKFTFLNNIIYTVIQKRFLKKYWIEEENIQSEEIEFFKEEEKEILNLTNDLKNLWIFGNEFKYFIVDEKMQNLGTFDLNNYNHLIDIDQKYPHNQTFSSTDIGTPLTVPDNFQYPKIIENIIFFFQSKKYLLLLIENEMIILYKILGKRLIKIDLNIPIAIHKKQENSIKILQHENFVLIQVNKEYVNLLFLKNDIENFKEAGNEFVNAFIVGDNIFTLAKNRINIYNYQNQLKNIYSSENSIFSAILLTEQQDQNKIHFLLAIEEHKKVNKLRLVSGSGITKNEINFESNEEITLVKVLKYYSIEKYLILIGYIQKINEEFFPKWKILHLEISSLGNPSPNFSYFLQQSSQEKNQTIREVFELERILFICLETLILQIEQNKITKVYYINFYQINKIAQKENFFLLADIKNQIKFVFFTGQTRELTFKSSTKVEGYIKSINFLKGSQRFIVLTHHFQLIGFLFHSKEVLNSQQVVIEKFFQISIENLEMIVTPEFSNFSCVLIDKYKKLYFLQIYPSNDFQIIKKLTKHMEETLPFIGGFSPQFWLQNQEKFISESLEVVFVDFLLFHQYLNQNYFSQKKLEDDIGFNLKKILNKI